jgi:glycosyltransferase involved in cell wall biosynthesis
MATECAFQRAARHFDHFIAVSANVAQEFMDTMKVAEDRVTTIPLGISEEFRVIEDRQASKNAIRERFDIANPYLLYVGALSSHKNVAALIDAYGILIESGRIEHSLVLVGPSDAAYYEELRRKIMDIKLADHVRFLGTVMQDSDDLPLLYNGADLFVFPTLYEAWTSPPLEAMACGTPVVTSNISSLPETVGNAALLFNPHDVEDIAHAIDQGLNDDSLRQSLIARGLERASRFTWQRMTNDTLKVYKKLA